MPYIGKSPEFGIRSRFIFDATASQTSFSGSDVNGITLTYTDTAYMDVFQNGVLLKAATDYTATTGTSVVLETGASVNDVVSMIIYDIFTVGDTVSAGSGGNFGGNVGMGGTLAVTGETTLSTHLNMGDNDKIKIGAGDDLEIYHDASNSYIDESGTGSLRIRSNRLRLEKHTGENMVECLEDGAVELYHNGTKRFETTATGVTAPGIISSSVGKSHIGEFTGNGTIAANQASIIQLQNCFSSAYSIYRIVGELGGDQSAEDVGKLRFLTSGTTSHDSGYYWGNLGIDDAGNRQLAADANQASFQWSKNLASSVSVHVDMHIYFGGIGGRIGILGRATYHDQGSDRGFMDFGGQSEGITSATGIEFFCTDGGNLAGYNFSVYGYRTQQGATGKMTGSYS